MAATDNIPAPVREAMERMTAEQAAREVRHIAESAMENAPAMPSVAAALLLAAQAVEREQWQDVFTKPPEELERVECWATGWASVAQGYRRGSEWRVWFGGEVVKLRPTLWRPLPPQPLQPKGGQQG